MHRPGGHCGGQACRSRLRSLRGDGASQCRRRQHHAPPGEHLAHLFQRPADAHLRRFFGRPQDGGHFPVVLALQKTQHDGVAIFFAQVADDLIQDGGLVPPRFFGMVVGVGLHAGLLLAADAPDFAAHIIGRCQPRRLEQPTGQHRPGIERTGFAGEDDENRLGDFLRLVMVAGVAQRRRINQVDMPPHERGKRLLGMTRRVFPQQFHVVHRRHLPINVRRKGKATAIFVRVWPPAWEAEGKGSAPES